MTSSSPPTLLRAVAEPRFLISAWPWRALGYAVSCAAACTVVWVFLFAPLLLLVEGGRRLSGDGSPGPEGAGHLADAASFGLMAVGLVGIAGPPLAVLLAREERWRLRLADDRPIREIRSGNLYSDAATWRAVAHALVLAVLTPVWAGVLALAALFVLTMIVSPFAVHLGSGPIVIGAGTVHSTGGAVVLAVAGLALIPLLAYLIAVSAGAQAGLARLLLAPAPDRSAAELVEVTRSRARLVGAFDAERHRIERDLHDGAQQRLVGLTMQTGLALLDLPEGSPAATAVGAAHEQAKALMVELRDLIHGINPRTLTELGLGAALEELAASGPLRVSVRADVGRLPPAVETSAYFAVAEALANVAKHSGVEEATVTAAVDAGVLAVEVRDGGAGGADPARGSGLSGLADRVAAVEGRLLLSSPVGGPTVLRIEVPCES